MGFPGFMIIEFDNSSRILTDFKTKGKTTTLARSAASREVLSRVGLNFRHAIMRWVIRQNVNMEASPSSFGVLVKMQPNSSKTHAFTRVLSDHFISKEKLIGLYGDNCSKNPWFPRSRWQRPISVPFWAVDLPEDKVEFSKAMTGSRRMLMPSGLFNWFGFVNGMAYYVD